MITQERLRELLTYDPETGIFRWKKERNHYVKAGKIAGFKHIVHGYMHIKIDYVLYRSHALAWLYVTGEFPVYPHIQIDHRNSKRDDNRFENLRKATHAQNA